MRSHAQRAGWSGRPPPVHPAGGTTALPSPAGWLPEDAVWLGNDYPHSAGWLVAGVSAGPTPQPREEKSELLTTHGSVPLAPTSSSRPASEKSVRPMG